MTINDASLGRFIQFMHKFCTNRRHDELKHATCLLATTFIIIRLLWIYGVISIPTHRYPSSAILVLASRPNTRLAEFRVSDEWQSLLLFVFILGFVCCFKDQNLFRSEG